MARLFSSLKSRHQCYCNRCLAWDKGISMVKPWFDAYEDSCWLSLISQTTFVKASRIAAQKQLGSVRHGGVGQPNHLSTRINGGVDLEIQRSKLSS
ncbi:hypothetical protein SDJN03_28898, partial [Cucurbita argyrosperma subsp. sororia]